MPDPLYPARLEMITGNWRMDDAKITGITPAVFTLSGIDEDDVPYLLLPRKVLVYCTGIRRSASLRRMTRTIIPIMIAMISAAAVIARAIVFPDTNCV